MPMWLLAVCMAGGLTGSAHVDVSTPKTGAVVARLDGPADVTKWVIGRVLSNLVWEGMTERQADVVLSLLPRPLPSGGLAGGSLWCCKNYDDYGFGVSFRNDGGGGVVLRVHSVYYYRPRR